MKLSVLLENTSCREDLTAEHGLSLYLEVLGKKVLFDMGQTDAFADNAEKMGIDLSQVDFAVLSHGHYDHGGGMKRFLELNQKAPVYVQRQAFLPHYNGTEKYIGLDPELQKSSRIILTDDAYSPAPGFFLTTCNERPLVQPINPYGLNVLEDGVLRPDDFRHEQYLRIQDGEKSILLSGCSHKGIQNIVSWFRPDLLIGGFHFKKISPEGEGAELLREAGNALLRFPTDYYTGHCTGQQQYALLKRQMGDRLHALSTGLTVTL